MNFREELGKVAPKIKQGARIYVFGPGENWRFIRRMYKSIVNINLEEQIEAFLDNDPQKQGTVLFGKKILSPDQIDTGNAVILIAAQGYKDFAIERQLFNMGLFCRSDFFGNEYFYFLLKRYLYVQLTKFQNKHDGERCFIIGNGPSLRSTDLDKLMNEKTFASNKIYLAYKNTSWRPTYYVIEDYIITGDHKEINREVLCEKFFALSVALNYEDFSAENAYFFDVDYRAFTRPYPYEVEFSRKPDYLFNGHTVTYLCLQLAVYMGFKKIYLLGIDNNYSLELKANGEVIINNMDNHFTPEYDIKRRSNFVAMDTDFSTAAYTAARKFAEENGIEIYNATRGGKLEVFQRVDFDSLF